MTHLKLSSALLITTIVFFASCKKEIPTNRDEQNETTGTTINSNALSLGAKARIASRLSTLPGTNFLQLQPAAAFRNLPISEFRELALRALQPAAAPCNDNTLLQQWVTQSVADWDEDMNYNAWASGMLDIPFYYAYVFENSSYRQYFGPTGEYTQKNTKTFKDLKRFWDIPSSGIVLTAFHGNVLRDRNKVKQTFLIVYALSEEDADFYTNLIADLLDNTPQYRNGTHPIFTLNAFASPAFDFNNTTIPSKICMGDGIQQAYTGIGYNDVAPQAIQAHEFGHQVQFALNIFGNLETPEETRRTELMADAYSAYFLSHSRGGGMQCRRLRQYLQVFYNIGDCDVTDIGHHGTPTQRMAAAEWAFTLSDDRRCHGRTMGSRQFATLFDAALPSILLH